MVLHIFTQVSDYALEFIRLLKEKFEPLDHILVFRNKSRKEILEGKFQGKIYFLETRKELVSNMPSLLKNTDKIIFHSFPVSRSLLFWYRHRKYCSKGVWSVWGQDAYWYNYCEKTLENRMYEWIRTRLIRRLHTILCPIRGDYDFIRDHYRTKAIYQPGMYPIPTDFEALRGTKDKKEDNGIIHIQVGNSANPTNNTIEIIRYLAKNMGGKYLVFCPVSYGDEVYAKTVIDFGNKELGDRFYPMTAFLDREQYASFVASVDILIMNHQRQQGLGNIFSYLYLGKKVYIRSDNSSFQFFEEHGIKVYDTRTLLTGEDTEWLTEMNPQVSKKNRQQTEKIVSLETIAPGWAKIFNGK
jgi:dTDP-N-acetylfucosamine:lipid II N-acetylfucosaminyltransferase